MREHQATHHFTRPIPIPFLLLFPLPPSPPYFPFPRSLPGNHTSISFHSIHFMRKLQSWLTGRRGGGREREREVNKATLG